MNESTQLIFERFGVSLLLGLLVGLQRQRSQSLLAGLRTFPLITVLGTLAATIDEGNAGGSWIVAAGLLGLVGIILAHQFNQDRVDPDHGLTTEAAILLMYLVGAYVAGGDRIVAIAIGSGVAVLLQFKPELHGIAERLGNEDLRAIMTFVLITCIVLPILPNKTYDIIPPLTVLNPFETWLMVVLMVGISLGGYLAYKFLGRNGGIVIGGLLGGVISSTATTMSYARRSRATPEYSGHAALVILIASIVALARIAVEIVVVTSKHAHELVPPVAILLGASAIATAVAWLRTSHTSEQMPLQKNPTELRSALVFATLYAGVLMALTVAQHYLSRRGLYAVALLSGLTDMDAITLSTARLVQQGPSGGGIESATGWRLIVVAAMANLASKWGLCVLVGHWSLSWRVGVLFAVPLITGGVLLAVGR